MRFLLRLNTKNENNEIIELNEFIREQNLKGLLTKVTENEPGPGTMGSGEFLPVIEMLFISPVVAAGIKGLFDIIVKYFELHNPKKAVVTEIEKTKSEESKIEFVIETSAGKKVSVKLNSFNEDERNLFFATVDKAINI